MKKNIFYSFLGFCLIFGVILCFTSCNRKNETGSIAPSSSGLEEAYFTLFEYLYETDPALNYESTYIALDLSNVQFPDTAPVITLFQDFCNANEYILLLNTYEELQEQGYINNLYFENGFIISFNDIKLDDDTLVTSARKWRSGLGAIGADYTVKKIGNKWEIVEIKNAWIS